MGQPYSASRADNRRLKVRSLPEEPLRTACVAELSVADNMALRDFDRPPLARAGLLNFAASRARAREWITAFGVKTRSEGAPMASLSGGNVQRAVLARELAGAAGDIHVLIASNPVFGLDFAAVSDIHARLRQVRAEGAAVLLVSEDLDELLELADRIVVMSEGRIVFETPTASAERHVLGAHMGGTGNYDEAASVTRWRHNVYLDLSGGDTTGYDTRVARFRLRQAFGRLIRSATDKGAFVLLDRSTPTRLLSAFPQGVAVQRVGLSEAAAQVREFLAAPRS